MGFDGPQSPAPTDDERELLLGFIAWQRAQVVAAADGLSDQELEWTPGGCLLPIGGIINHLTHMEWRWVEGRYLASPFPPREVEHVVPEGVSGSDLVDAYWQQARRTEEIVRAAPSLDALCLGDEGGRGPAHHSGHADSTREMLDGKKMRR